MGLRGKECTIKKRKDQHNKGDGFAGFQDLVGKEV